MTVLVTGATGLLGSHLTDLLLERGERPRVLVRAGESVTGLANSRVDIQRGDMDDPASLKSAVRDVHTVLHCAARTGPWGSRQEYDRTNVQGLKTLVEVALEAGVGRVVHVSSITVHGNDVGGEADETAPLRIERNPYSESKVAGERLLLNMIRDQHAPVTIVRPGWIYGPGDTASFARFAALIQQGRMVMIGSGDNHVPLIYVGDAARGVLLAGEADEAVGRTYLLVNDEAVTQREYLGAIAAALGAPFPKRRIPYRLALVMGTAAETAARLARRRQAPPVMRYGVQLLGGENRFNIDRARHELAFSPQVNMDEGIRCSAAWYQSVAARVAA